MLIGYSIPSLFALPSDLPYLAGNRSQLLGKLFKSDYLSNIVVGNFPQPRAQHSCGARVKHYDVTEQNFRNQKLQEKLIVDFKRATMKPHLHDEDPDVREGQDQIDDLQYNC